jgi:signal transduction histidine kinase
LLLTHLVDDLRTLALAESGGLKLERTTVDLAQLIERLVERFRPQAEMGRIRLEFYPSTAEQIIILADPMRLDQILSNLLSNALRYTPEGGAVLVQVMKQRSQAVVSVSDSGPGIPEEALDRVFERFYRADRARSREAGGTGLGLAIARKLAEEHGGTLRAANLPTGGAQFILELPLQSAESG